MIAPEKAYGIVYLQVFMENFDPSEDLKKLYFRRDIRASTRLLVLARCIQNIERTIIFAWIKITANEKSKIWKAKWKHSLDLKSWATTVRELSFHCSGKAIQKLCTISEQ